MANDAMLDNAKKLIQTADLLRQSADEMADRRAKDLADGTITDAQFRHNVVRENVLRNDVSEILLKAVKSAVAGIQGEQADLEEAIRSANQTIQRIDELKKALSVFASVIGLAEAIVLGKPGGILAAFKAVQKTATI